LFIQPTVNGEFAAKVFNGFTIIIQKRSEEEKLIQVLENWIDWL
jgi:hypothetical protein